MSAERSESSVEFCAGPQLHWVSGAVLGPEAGGRLSGCSNGVQATSCWAAEFRQSKRNGRTRRNSSMQTSLVLSSKIWSQINLPLVCLLVALAATTSSVLREVACQEGAPQVSSPEQITQGGADGQPVSSVEAKPEPLLASAVESATSGAKQQPQQLQAVANSGENQAENQTPLASAAAPATAEEAPVSESANVAAASEQLDTAAASVKGDIKQAEEQPQQQQTLAQQQQQEETPVTESQPQEQQPSVGDQVPGSENVSVQAEQQQQQQQQSADAIDQSMGFAHQSQDELFGSKRTAPTSSVPSDEQQSGGGQYRASGQPAERGKPSKSLKRSNGGHLGVFGRKAKHAPQQQQQQESASETSSVAPNAGFKGRSHHYYYHSIGSQSVPQQQQQKQQQQRGSTAPRQSTSAKLKQADYPDYREILIQQEPGQQQAADYEQQQQQKQQQQEQQQQQQQQEASTINEEPRIEQEKMHEFELVSTTDGPQVVNEQASLIQQPPLEESADDTDGQQRSQADSNSQSGAGPYIRLSNIATINGSSLAPANQSQATGGIGGGEMKLMRIYVIDLDQKLVVGNGANGMPTGEQLGSLVATGTTAKPGALNEYTLADGQQQQQATNYIAEQQAETSQTVYQTMQTTAPTTTKKPGPQEVAPEQRATSSVQQYQQPRQQQQYQQQQQVVYSVSTAQPARQYARQPAQSSEQQQQAYLGPAQQQEFLALDSPQTANLSQLLVQAVQAQQRLAEQQYSASPSNHNSNHYNNNSNTYTQPQAYISGVQAQAPQPVYYNTEPTSAYTVGQQASQQLNSSISYGNNLANSVAYPQVVVMQHQLQQHSFPSPQTSPVVAAIPLYIPPQYSNSSEAAVYHSQQNSAEHYASRPQQSGTNYTASQQYQRPTVNKASKNYEQMAYDGTPQAAYGGPQPSPQAAGNYSGEQAIIVRVASSENHWKPVQSSWQPQQQQQQAQSAQYSIGGQQQQQQQAIYSTPDHDVVSVRANYSAPDASGYEEKQAMMAQGSINRQPVRNSRYNKHNIASEQTSGQQQQQQQQYSVASAPYSGHQQQISNNSTAEHQYTRNTKLSNEAPKIPRQSASGQQRPIYAAASSTTVAVEATEHHLEETAYNQDQEVGSYGYESAGDDEQATPVVDEYTRPSARPIQAPYRTRGAQRRPPGGRAPKSQANKYASGRPKSAARPIQQVEHTGDQYSVTGVAEYLAPADQLASAGYSSDGDKIKYASERPQMRPTQYMQQPQQQQIAYYRPAPSKGLLSWETISSVASGAAKRIPTAISSLFGVGSASAGHPLQAQKGPLYTTIQQQQYPYNQYASINPVGGQQYTKSAHFDRDVSNFHRPYPLRHMSPPESYSDAPPASAESEDSLPALEQQPDESDLSSSSSGNSYASPSSASSSSSGNEAELNQQAASSLLNATEPVADLAEISADGSQSSRAAAAKQRQKQPMRHQDSMDGTLLSVSIEHQLEAHPKKQQQNKKRRAKKHGTTKQTHSSGAADELSATTLVDPAILSAAQASGQPLSLDQLPPTEQQRLLQAANKQASKLTGGVQSPMASLPATGVMFGAAGAPGSDHAQRGQAANGISSSQLGLASVQIGQYKITPQTQFVQSIIEPSRHMLGQYFKQYIGQLGQLG